MIVAPPNRPAKPNWEVAKLRWTVVVRTCANVVKRRRLNIKNSSNKSQLAPANNNNKDPAVQVKVKNTIAANKTILVRKDLMPR